MKLRSLLFLAAAFGLTLSAYADWGRRHTEPFSMQGDFAPDGTVTVHNVNGRVTIETWDRDAYAIEGEKKAKSQEDLDLIELQWDVDHDHIALKVKLPKKKGWFNWGNVDGQVDVTIKVPATVNLKDVSTVNGGVELSGLRGIVHASTVNGAVSARNLAGSAKLSTVNGGVTAEFDAVPDTARLELSTVNGGIKLRLPSDAGASIHGSVVNGSINADIPITMKGKIGRKSLNGTIGEGNAVIEMSTVNGGIKIQSMDS